MRTDLRRLAAHVEAQGVDPGGLVLAAGRPTTRKTRVVARSQQMRHFDRETHERGALPAGLAGARGGAP